jgi:hypothetical protein
MDFDDAPSTPTPPRENHIAYLKLEGAVIYGRNDEAPWNLAVEEYGIDTVKLAIQDVKTDGKELNISNVGAKLRADYSASQDEIDRIREASMLGVKNG